MLCSLVGFNCFNKGFVTCLDGSHFPHGADPAQLAPQAMASRFAGVEGLHGSGSAIEFIVILEYSIGQYRTAMTDKY